MGNISDKEAGMETNRICKGKRVLTRIKTERNICTCVKLKKSNLCMKSSMSCVHTACSYHLLYLPMWKELSECCLNLLPELMAPVVCFFYKLYFSIEAFLFMCIPGLHITMISFSIVFNSWNSWHEQHLLKPVIMWEWGLPARNPGPCMC